MVKSYNWGLRRPGNLYRQETTNTKRGIIMKNIEARAYLYEGTNKGLKAFATITVDVPGINSQLVIKNFTVRDGKNGLFVSYPSHFDKKNNEYRDDVFPLTKEGREAINDAIMDAYYAAEKWAKSDTHPKYIR